MFVSLREKNPHWMLSPIIIIPQDLSKQTWKHEPITL